MDIYIYIHIDTYTYPIYNIPDLTQKYVCWVRLFLNFRVLKAKLFQGSPAIGCIQRTPQNGDVPTPAHLGTGPLDIRLLDIENAIGIQKATPSLHQISSHAAASQKTHEGQEGLWVKLDSTSTCGMQGWQHHSRNSQYG